MPTSTKLTPLEKPEQAITSAPSRASKTGPLTTALQVVVAFAAITILVEGIFALSGIGESEYLHPEAITGYSGIPNKSVTHRKEGFGRFRYNSFGMQDIEWSIAKPANTKRIAFLGDSFVEALQLDRSKNFCNLLEQRLNGAQAQRFQVMNFGVSSNNLAQIYLRNKHLVSQFHPDIVIIGVRPDAALQLAPNPTGGFFSARPNFFTDGKGNLIEDRTVQKYWLSTAEGKRMRTTEWLRCNSRIWGVLGIAAEQVAAWAQQVKQGTAHWGAAVENKQTAFAPIQKKASSAVDSTAAAQPTAEQLAFNRRNYDGATKALWPIADALIDHLNRDCTSNCCKLVLVRFPGAGNWKNEYETILLKETAKRYSIPFEDCGDTFDKAFAEHKNKALFYDGHFKPLSHHILADELYDLLSQNRITQPNEMTR